MHQLHAGLFNHFKGQWIRIAGLVIDHANAGIDDHFGTDRTWLVCAKQAGVLDRHTVVCRLDNGILLGMDTPAQFVPLAGRDIQFFPQAANFLAVPDIGRGSVISGGQNLFVLHDNRTNSPAEASRAFCNQRCDIHEVGFPRRARFCRRHYSYQSPSIISTQLKAFKVHR